MLWSCCGNFETRKQQKPLGSCSPEGVMKDSKSAYKTNGTGNMCGSPPLPSPGKGRKGREGTKGDGNICKHEFARYNKSRCVAARCGVSQYVVVRYVTLRPVAAPCGTLRGVAERCVTLRHVAVRCGTLRYVTLRYGMLQCVVARC